MDEEANAGDDQQHHERELIEHKAEIDVQRAGGDPLRRMFNIGGQNIRLQPESSGSQHDEQ